MNPGDSKLVAYLVVASLVVAPMVHIAALWMSRRGRGRAHGLAFVAGVLGLLSLPAVLLVSLMAMPFAITGTAGHPLHWVFPAAWIVLWALVPCSALAAWRARRAPAGAA